MIAVLNHKLLQQFSLHSSIFRVVVANNRENVMDIKLAYNKYAICPCSKKYLSFPSKKSADINVLCSNLTVIYIGGIKVIR